MGKILAVCTSEKKGTLKTNVGKAELVMEHGLYGDAHAGDWHRQVSLLSYEKVEEFKARGANVEHGAFGENIVAEGIDFGKLPVGTHLRCGNVELEVTQIGKECHHSCAIRQQVGDCIMPREGIFARVLTGGTISVGEEINVCQ
ncbi:MAG: MOSC domain-containing protein [Oscillospiraceae bacterium]